MKKEYHIIMDGEWLTSMRTKKEAIALIRKYRQFDKELCRRAEYYIIKGRLINVPDLPAEKSKDRENI